MSFCLVWRHETLMHLYFAQQASMFTFSYKTSTSCPRDIPSRVQHVEQSLMLSFKAVTEGRMRGHTGRLHTSPLQHCLWLHDTDRSEWARALQFLLSSPTSQWDRKSRTLDNVKLAVKKIYISLTKFLWTFNFYTLLTLGASGATWCNTNTQISLIRNNARLLCRCMMTPC